MRERPLKKRDKSQVFLVFVIVLISLVIVGVTLADLARILKTRGEIRKVKINIGKLEREAEELRREVEWLSTHPGDLEPFAKDELEVQRPGERVVVVVKKK